MSTYQIKTHNPWIVSLCSLGLSLILILTLREITTHYLLITVLPVLIAYRLWFRLFAVQSDVVISDTGVEADWMMFPIFKRKRKMIPWSEIIGWDTNIGGTVRIFKINTITGDTYSIRYISGWGMKNSLFSFIQEFSANCDKRNIRRRGAVV